MSDETQDERDFYQWLISHAATLKAPPTSPTDPPRCQAMGIAAWLSDQETAEANPPPTYGLSGYGMFKLLEDAFLAGRKTTLT